MELLEHSPQFGNNIPFTFPCCVPTFIRVPHYEHSIGYYTSVPHGLPSCDFGMGGGLGLFIYQIRDYNSLIWVRCHLQVDLTCLSIVLNVTRDSSVPKVEQVVYKVGKFRIEQVRKKYWM